jgi:hypothetical protein
LRYRFDGMPIRCDRSLKKSLRGAARRSSEHHVKPLSERDVRDLVIKRRVDRTIGPRRRQSRSSTVPSCTRAPAASSFLPDASDRASPVTLCPAAINSFTIANPMNPVAPVTNTRMIDLLA